MGRGRRRKKKRRNIPNLPLSPGMSISGLVVRQAMKGNLPKPSIPVAVRDEAVELKMAEDTTATYMRLAMETFKPWFHCTRKKHKYTEDFMLITPEMAAQALDFNPDNRRMSNDQIDAYRRDIESGNWVITHQGLGFDISGNLFDGQHRLMALVDADRPCILQVTFNCPVESRVATDIGKKRRDDEQIKYATGEQGRSSIVRAMMRGVDPGKPIYTTAEIALFQAKHGPTIETARSLIGGGITKRADVFAALAKAILWYGKERLEPFCERFRTIMYNGKNDPAALLYSNLMKAKKGSKQMKQHECYRLTLSAIEAEIKGKKLTRLISRNVDIFKWQPGWEVPPNNDK